MNYQEVFSWIAGEEKLACIFEESIGFIPIDEANTDYQAYLLWLEEQA